MTKLLPKFSGGYVFFILLVCLVGLFLRTYNVNFGLPHSYHADEREIVEPAITYTYEFRDIIQNQNWYKMIPISYVYGAFPTYVFTLLLMVFSKIMGVLNIKFSFLEIYSFLRLNISVFSVLVIPLGAFLYFKIFGSKFGAIFCAILLAFNWKLIMHSHYVNMDMIITVLLLLAYLLVYFYLTSSRQKLITLVLGVVLGLAIGTKITSGMVLLLITPLYLYKKDFSGLAMLVLLIIATFLVTNPFSFLFYQDFFARVMQMNSQEAGIVLDSVDFGYFKYIFALSWISTLPVLIFSLFGIYGVARNIKSFHKINSSYSLFNIFLILNIILYLVFYSLGARRVDRWLLPILPIVLIYAAVCLDNLYAKFLTTKYTFTKFLIFLMVGFSALYYVGFTRLLLSQYTRFTPKASAYLWSKNNILPQAHTLVITEEGWDPFIKISNATVIQSSVYETNGALGVMPPDLTLYDYVVLSSKPMQNFKKPYVQVTYPEYNAQWYSFEKTLLNPQKYQLLQEFSLPKPNLANLSDVYIYKRL